MRDSRYPIGKFQKPATFTNELLQQYIQTIEQLPELLRHAVEGLDDEQLNTPYRESGWTVRQVVHHIADSHLNSYTRFRLALTEDSPTIKTYSEQNWAELEDAKYSPIFSSLSIIDGLHHRWTMLLRSFSEKEWKKTFIHPELGPLSLDVTTALYAWHSEHHVAHITTLRKQRNW
ncbi:YfiT family bacillithiol transferase [Shimazuella alba]|uniref:Putative metal-dependent hydrolase GSM42_04505 n=1 Tax=Shimazuella alba TaxID=2690964 RepID=A0A6I4VSV9_9BACL|nr:putative metal-dependent hydrolase [Shimazuella alba]MXQ53006.1 putative metal-dependent hydrolase [Shimazuella alba]